MRSRTWRTRRASRCSTCPSLFRAALVAAIVAPLACPHPSPGTLLSPWSSRAPSPSRCTGSTTWDDFILLDHDDTRELIDGELVEVEVPTWQHEHFVMTLGCFLVGWARQHGGMVLASGYEVTLPEPEAPTTADAGRRRLPAVRPT